MVKRFQITAYLVNSNVDYIPEEREKVIEISGANYRYTLPVDMDRTRIEQSITKLIQVNWMGSRGHFFEKRDLPEIIKISIQS